jgi:hypothetical protein
VIPCDSRAHVLVTQLVRVLYRKQQEVLTEVFEVDFGTSVGEVLAKLDVRVSLAYHIPDQFVMDAIKSYLRNKSSFEQVSAKASTEGMNYVTYDQPSNCSCLFVFNDVIYL